MPSSDGVKINNGLGIRRDESTDILVGLYFPEIKTGSTEVGLVSNICAIFILSKLIELVINDLVAP